LAAPELSVIIPCRNCAPRLGHQLEAIARQAFERSWEVIVVDNGSEDDARIVAERFSDELPITIVRASRTKGPSYARNVGARAARAPKLVFVDADDEVGEGYLAAMDRALESSGFVSASVDLEALNPEWSRRAHGLPWHRDGVELSFGFLPAASSCVGMRKEVFDRVEGWPEAFVSQEDTALSWKVQLAGTPLTLERDAVYRYRFRADLPGLFHQSRMWSTGLPLLYREFRNAGMHARSREAVLSAWKAAARGLVSARSRADVAVALVQLGDCVGRIGGSLRYRCLYL
jgi:glycosyltransferase involved in cell wall biosynthesis